MCTLIPMDAKKLSGLHISKNITNYIKIKKEPFRTKLTIPPIVEYLFHEIVYRRCAGASQ